MSVNFPSEFYNDIKDKLFTSNIFCKNNLIVHSYFINTFMFDITRMIHAVGFSECNTSTIKVSMMFS